MVPAEFYDEARKEGWLYPLDVKSCSQNSFKRRIQSLSNRKPLATNLKTGLNGQEVAYVVDERTRLGFYRGFRCIASITRGCGKKGPTFKNVKVKN